MAVQAVYISVSDDLKRSRLTVFFRLLLAAPHLIVFAVIGATMLLLSVFSWLVVLVTGRMPESLHDFYASLVRYAVHTYAYVYLAAEPWPPFLGQSTYPVDVWIPPPAGHQNRWTVAFRLLLALPALMLAGAFGAGVSNTSATAVYFSFGVLPVVAVLAWFACLARGRMPAGIRDLVVYGLGYTAQAYAYLLLLTPRYPNSDPEAIITSELPAHPVALRVREDNLERLRLMVFFRGPLAVPHLVWLLLWSMVAVFAGLAAWLAALITGRVPAPLHRFLAARLRYQTHVYGFLYLVAEAFPGFVGAPDGSPVKLELPTPERQSRWTVLFRLVLVVPALLITSALGSVQTIASVMGWFASLFTGRMPAGVRSLLAYTLRYQAQTSAYVTLLTPSYPYSGPGRCAP